MDFVINGTIAIEVKSAKSIFSSDLKGLEALSQDVQLKRKIVVCNDLSHSLANDVEVMNFQDFIEELWSGKLVVK